MPTACFSFVLSSLLALCAAGCGGGTNGGGTNIVGQDTMVTVTLLGSAPGDSPQSLAVKIGSGSFTLATLNGNLLTFTVPAGTTSYGIAWVCPSHNGSDNKEDVFEATIQDGTAFTLSCFSFLTPSPTPTPVPRATASGNVDASAILNANEVDISGRDSSAGFLASATGPFNVSLETGVNDIALKANQSQSIFPFETTLAVKIFRNQTLPGSINGGNTVTFDSADLVTMQPLTLSNLQPGFLPIVFAAYRTQNGSFILDFPNNASQYPAIPAAAVQTGDFYQFQVSANQGLASGLIFAQNTTAAGGPFTIALPDPWIYSGPTPSASPTFTFNYPFAPGMQIVGESATITWTTPSALMSHIAIDATQSFLNGTTTLTIPDLSGIPGFLVPPSGTSIQWRASIGATTVPGPNAATAAPGPNSSSLGLSAGGSYTVP